MAERRERLFPLPVGRWQGIFSLFLATTLTPVIYQNWPQFDQPVVAVSFYNPDAQTTPTVEPTPDPNLYQTITLSKDLSDQDLSLFKYWLFQDINRLNDRSIWRYIDSLTDASDPQTSGQFRYSIEEVSADYHGEKTYISERRLQNINLTLIAPKGRSKYPHSPLIYMYLTRDLSGQILAAKTGFDIDSGGALYGGLGYMTLSFHQAEKLAQKILRYPPTSFKSLKYGRGIEGWSEDEDYFIKTEIFAPGLVSISREIKQVPSQ